jgi:hypothetical protein
MPAANPDSSLWIGEWLVNPALDTISRGAETHKLEPRTMRLLMCLASIRPRATADRAGALSTRGTGRYARPRPLAHIAR